MSFLCCFMTSRMRSNVLSYSCGIIPPCRKMISLTDNRTSGLTVNDIILTLGAFDLALHNIELLSLVMAELAV